MGVIIRDKLRKPTPWGLKPGLVAPEWGWFWQKPSLAVITQPGLNQFDYAGRSMGTVNGDPVEGVTQLGHSLVFDGASDAIAYSGKPSSESTADVTIGITFTLDQTALSKNILDTADSTNTGFRMGWNSPGGPEDFAFTKGGVVAINIFAGALFTVGDLYTVVITYRASDGRIFAVLSNVTGAVIATTTTTNASAPKDGDGVIALGGGSWASSSTHTGNFLMGYVNYRLSSDAGVLQLAQDPFGPFRMADDTSVFFVPAVSFDSTGALLFSKLAMAGTGTAGASAAGAPLLDKLAMAGTGAQNFSAAGVPLLDKLAIVGTGTAGFTSTGAPVLDKLAMSGTGVQNFSATGAPLLDKLSVSGTGTTGASGVGSLLLNKLVASATAVTDIVEQFTIPIMRLVTRAILRLILRGN